MPLIFFITQLKFFMLTYNWGILNRFLAHSVCRKLYRKVFDFSHLLFYVDLTIIQLITNS